MIFIVIWDIFLNESSFMLFNINEKKNFDFIMLMILKKIYLNIMNLLFWIK